MARGVVSTAMSELVVIQWAEVLVWLPAYGEVAVLGPGASNGACMVSTSSVSGTLGVATGIFGRGASREVKDGLRGVVCCTKEGKGRDFK